MVQHYLIIRLCSKKEIDKVFEFEFHDADDMLLHFDLAINIFHKSKQVIFHPRLVALSNNQFMDDVPLKCH